MNRRPTPDILADAQLATDAVAMAMGPQAQRIATVHIRLDGGTQPRAGIDQAVVDDYHNDMQAGAQFPPIELVYDGKDYWLWDGFHRFHAWRKDGDRLILANVRQGTRRDAVLLSVGANATHGFRRTNGDKRRAVLALLQDEEWRQWSDREIARRCAVSNQFVSNMRAELSVNDGQIGKRRVERNGVEYDMKLPQRSSGPAVAATAGNYATPDELDAAVRSWLVAWDTTEEREAALVEVIELGEGSVTFDDLVEWIGSVRPRRTADLLQAAARVLVWLRQQAEPAAEMGALEAVLHRRAQQPLVAWTAEELEEELLELESVSLAGADEDWLFDHMTDIGKRLGRSLTRPVFDMAMRLAMPRQIAALQRQDRLERAQAAAMAADAQRPKPTAADMMSAVSSRLRLLWARGNGGDTALRALLEELEQPGFPYVGSKDQWRNFEAWYKQTYAGEWQPSMWDVREVLRKIAPPAAEAQPEPPPDDTTSGPAVRTRNMEFEKKYINQGKTIKLFGRNVDGTLTVTVNTEKLHLYSPGVTITPGDAYNLTVMMQRALGEMHLAKQKETNHA
jgi:hypothetical protein